MITLRTMNGWNVVLLKRDEIENLLKGLPQVRYEGEPTIVAVSNSEIEQKYANEQIVDGDVLAEAIAHVDPRI